MLKIRKIEIVGFKANNRRAEVEFSSENISIVYGENGVGKTTLLKILFAILSHDEEQLRKENVAEIRIIYNYSDHNTKKDELIIIKRVSETRKVVTVNEAGKKKEIVVRMDIHYDWSEYEKSPLFDSKSMSIGVQRGIPTQSKQIEPESILRFFSHPRNRDLFVNQSEPIEPIAFRLADYLNHDTSLSRRRDLFRKKELRLEDNHVQFNTINIDEIEFLLIERFKTTRLITNRKIQNALFDTLALAIEGKGAIKNKIPSDFYKKLMENQKRLIEALSDTEDNKLKAKLLNIVQELNETKYKEISSSNNLIASLLIKMTEELENEKQFISSINTVLDLFNHFIQKGKMLVIDGDNLEVRIGKRRHPLSDLSSGERHLLTLLSLIIIDAHRRNFIIIDEPEISLNINWQRNILPLFSELAPDTQIIVASHSPSLAKKSSNYLSPMILHEGE